MNINPGVLKIFYIILKNNNLEPLTDIDTSIVKQTLNGDNYGEIARNINKNDWNEDNIKTRAEYLWKLAKQALFKEAIYILKQAQFKNINSSQETVQTVQKIISKVLDGKLSDVETNPDIEINPQNCLSIIRENLIDKTYQLIEHQRGFCGETDQLILAELWKDNSQKYTTIREKISKILSDKGRSTNELNHIGQRVDTITAKRIKEYIQTFFDTFINQLPRLTVNQTITSPPPLPPPPEDEIIYDDFDDFSPIIYVKRPPIEEECIRNIKQPGSILRIKAPEKIGKSKLIEHISKIAKEELGYNKVFIDLEGLESDVRQNHERFLYSITFKISKQLKIKFKHDTWKSISLTPNIKTESYLEEEILPTIKRSLLVCLYNVDKLFEVYANPDTRQSIEDFFALLRSWNNIGKQDLKLENWGKFHLVLAYSTEIYIPLDINKSPFNVGLDVELSDFNFEQIKDLAEQNKLDWSDSKLEQLTGVTRNNNNNQEASKLAIGGNPYLLQKAFEYFKNDPKTKIEDFFNTALTEKGIYEDYLEELLQYIKTQPALKTIMKILIEADKPIEIEELKQEGKIALQEEYSKDENLFTKLIRDFKRLGVINQRKNRIDIRCNFYRTYFQKKISKN